MQITNISTLSFALFLFVSLSFNPCLAENQTNVGYQQEQKLNTLIMQPGLTSSPVQPEEEAYISAHRLKSISETIKTHYQNFIAGASISAINTAVAAKLKAIINTMEMQRKIIVDYITNESRLEQPDPEKLNSAINELNNQRRTLSELLSLESEKVHNTTTFNTPNQKNEHTLKVFSN